MHCDLLVTKTVLSYWIILDWFNMTKKHDSRAVNCYKHLFRLCVLLLFTGNTHAQKVDLNDIKKAIDEIKQSHQIAAVSVLVVSRDKVWINEHTGLTDWRTKRPFMKGDMYRIGSISKSFAGVLALRLQQKGLINLADSVSEYGLEPYLNNTYSGDDITLAQLLEHTAGLSDLAKAEWDYNDPKPIKLKSAFELKLGNQQTRWPPGRFQSYSNVGAGLFGLALELKLGLSYELLMQKYVFDPLTMSSSSLLLTPHVSHKLITGYDRDGKTPINYWHNIYRPFAAINTDSQDMILWLQMLLQTDDSFLSASSRKRMITPSTDLAAQSGLTYGYGLGVYQWQTNGYSFYGHGGDADGYLTRFGLNKETGLAYFVMINAFNKKPLNQLVNMLEQRITENLPKARYPLRIKPDDQQMVQLVGKYRPVTARFKNSLLTDTNHLNVFVRNQQLYYRYKNQTETALHRVQGNQFRTRNDSVATMAFIEYQGKLYFKAQEGYFVHSDE